MVTKQCNSNSSRRPDRWRAAGALLLMLLTGSMQAQTMLDGYIREGLQSNIVLQEKSLSLEQANQSLLIARSYFLPSITLLGDYTSGEGGRSIAIPVGDLLNPVYATLNQMTQSDAFPQIANVEQNFFPKNFYDARVRASVPIINTDLYFNHTIQGQQVMIKQFEMDSYRRQLVMEIKTSYYRLLSARAALAIYEGAVDLLRKNVSVNESLQKNGKNLHANVLRSKSELERVKAELNDARNQEKNAQRYVNFLLNRPLDQFVETQTADVDAFREGPLAGEQGRREEIRLLKSLEAVNLSTLKMRQLNRLPKVNAFIDVGSQAYDWNFDEKSRYYLFGVQLAMPLFQGFRNNLAIRQSDTELKKTRLQSLNAERQIVLATEVAANEVQTARQNHAASQEQLKSAQSYFGLVEKGYREGVNALLEYIDARNQLTTSQLQENLRMYQVLIAEAKFERETASYHLEN